MRKLLAAIALALYSGCAIAPVAPTSPVEIPAAPRAVVVPLKGADGDCSGVVVAPNLVLTARHCEAAGEITVFGKPAKTLRIAKDDDLMLLGVEIECPCAPLGVIAAVNEGVIVIGFPYGRSLGPTIVVTPGEVQGDAVVENFGHVYILTALASPGNSGGGVFALQNGRWQLVGILVGGGASVTLAVHTNDIRGFLHPQIASNDESPPVGHP